MIWRRAPLLVAFAAVLGAGALAAGLGGPPALGTACGQLRCATFAVGLVGNGTGVLAVVTSTGALTGTIECHRAGSVTSGTCSFSYPAGIVIYYRIGASPGSRTTCKVVGCDTSTSIKHFTLSSNMTLSGYGFALLDPVTITVSVIGSGSGSVTSKPAGLSCGAGKSACAVAFAAGSSVTLTAAASGGSSFKGWTGGCAGNQTGCSVSPSSGTSVAVGAQFALIVTSTPTPKPTAAHVPTPRPTSQPTNQPAGKTSSPAETPPPGATIPPSGGTSAPPSTEGSSDAPPNATAGPTLAPLDTPAADSGQPASSAGSASSLLVMGLVVLLIVFAGGAFVFRKPRPKT